MMNFIEKQTKIYIFINFLIKLIKEIKMTYNFTFKSPNFNDRSSAGISLIILHYTDMTSAEEALERLCNPAHKVSAHYLIHKSGEIIQLVEDAKRAWHAGVSYWHGQTDINDISIGIELDNGGHLGNLEPYTEAQLSALLNLLAHLCQTHKINPKNVIGHSDVAPSRKKDPGEHFPWEILKKNGFGIWPEPFPIRHAPISVTETQHQLRKIGYDCPTSGEIDLQTQLAITAFQRHFTPSEITGTITDKLKYVLSCFNV